MGNDAAKLIAALDLQPHPEGGWYRETWRAAGAPGERSAGTAIFFLLEHGQRSHWHRVDGDELWFWHAGAPIDLGVEQEDGTVAWISLGSDIASGQAPQALVPAGRWQSAEARSGWALMSCTVTPGFDFSGFELAPPGWAPARVDNR